jgi:phosphoribosylformylglycinamidine cyclo-ligase
MNVNDILCTGARTLFFIDYIACGKLKPGVLYDVVKGITHGCLQAGCALIGGETAEMPGMYQEGEYDIAGFCVGVVERDRIIDGSKIEAGNVVVGLESNGIHSNGYSLVRKVFSQKELRRMSSELLKPTRIYTKPVLSFLRTTNDERRGTISGISHITGGAFYDKIARILPDNISVRIYKDSWPVPEIFRLIQNKGNIEPHEMYHTFNMGVGIVLIVARDSAKKIIAKLSSGFGLSSWVIGEAVRGKKEVEII